MRYADYKTEVHLAHSSGKSREGDILEKHVRGRDHTTKKEKAE